MKRIITIYILSGILPACMCGQVVNTGYITANKLEASATIYTVESKPADEPKYEVDNVAKRKDFYEKTAFDPAADYTALYSQSANNGIPAQSDKGVIKILTDNNTAPIVYYNKAAIGTIVKLSNPDNGKETYAIVVGKIPPIDGQAYIVELNLKAAHNLGTKDYTTVQLNYFSASDTKDSITNK